MNTASFHKSTNLLFIGLGAFLALPPLVEIFNIFQQLDFSNLREIFTQSKDIRQHIKSLATYGILLILSFFTLTYTVLSYTVEPRLKKTCLAFLVFVFIGGIGFLIRPDHHVTYRLVNHAVEDIHMTNAELSIKFKEIPQDLSQDINKALLHEVILSVTPKFFQNAKNTNTPISINNKYIMSGKDYILSEDDLTTLLTKGVITFKINDPQSSLVVRDIKGSPLHERDDICKINGKTINLPYDGSLWVYIKVQTIEGRPLRVYY